MQGQTMHDGGVTPLTNQKVEKENLESCIESTEQLFVVVMIVFLLFDMFILFIYSVININY